MPKPASPQPLPDTSISLGVLHDIIGFKIRRIQNSLARSFYEAIHPHQARPGAFSALALISANPGMSQTDLAREIGFDKALVVGLLDSMEANGWTVRTRSTSDRRRHELSVTPAGQAALSELLELAHVNEARVREALTAAERRTLFALLDKVYLACFPGLGGDER
jgi:DNA-binding MarR family transcriptional regulator